MEWWESKIEFKPGQTYRAWLHGKSYKIHILAIVENMIVYRFYGTYQQWWHYEIKLPHEVQMYIDRNKKIEKSEGE